MKLALLGVLFCLAAVKGETLTGYDELPAKRPNVLRIVSTVIPPYLKLRPKPESEPEAEDDDIQNSTKMDWTDDYSDDESLPGADGVINRLKRDANESSIDTPASNDTEAATAIDESIADAPAVPKFTSPPEKIVTTQTSNPETAGDATTLGPTTLGKTDTNMVTTLAVTPSSTSTSDTGTEVTTKKTESVTEAATEATTVGTTLEPEPMTPFEGFIPDLMDALLPHIPNITAYEIYTVEGDEHKSSYEKMIQEITAGRADIAAAPMTVTLNKENYVDFTYPFQRVEATIVMHKTLGERFKTLEDLVNQDAGDDDHKKVNYGAKRDGAIHKVLVASDDPLHKKMLAHMEADGIALKSSNAQGVNRARWGGYAFIIESSLADWVVGQPPCSLVGVRAGFFKRQYAFAVRQRSELRDTLNRALVEVDSEVDKLRDRWLTPGECSGASWITPHTMSSSIFFSFLTILLSHYL